MKNHEIADLSNRHDYVLKSTADTRLSRCACTSCYTENIVAIENNVIIPSEQPIPVRMALCEEKKERKKVTFEYAQILFYNVNTESVYENGKVKINFSRVKKKMGMLRSVIRKRNKTSKKKRIKKGYKEENQEKEGFRK